VQCSYTTAKKKGKQFKNFTLILNSSYAGAVVAERIKRLTYILTRNHMVIKQSTIQ